MKLMLPKAKHRIYNLGTLKIATLFALSSSLFLFLIIFTLTGFVCTHKIQAEEECLSSNVLCYECDSRYDPNCADPFDFSSSATLQGTSSPDQQNQATYSQLNLSASSKTSQYFENNSSLSNAQQQQQQLVDGAPIKTNSNGTLNSSSLIPLATRQQKKLPTVAVCHGCCVKITSKSLDGGSYVKRTCTTNLQINYFMVGLVCMKESGDRGKMCFCETDYCNGQITNTQSFGYKSILVLIISIILFYYSDIYFFHD